MTIGWDPKVKAGAVGPARVGGDVKPAPATEERPALLTPDAPIAAPVTDRAATHPSRIAPPAGPSLFEKEAARLREQLRGDRATRQKAGEQAVAMASRYTLRRARGSRRLGLELMEDAGQAVPELKETAGAMRALLLAEDELHELTPEGTLSALQRLADVHQRALDGEAGREVMALSRALTGAALLQATMHFPDVLEQLELDAEGAFNRAVGFAEEAIVTAPKQADGHALLGRLVLAHDGDEAARDAEAVFRHALTLDAEHDAAELGLAAALREQGKLDEARERLERVHKRGSPRPQAHLLAALIHEDRGELPEAVAAAERALKLAPKAEQLEAEAERLRKRTISR